MVDPPLDPRSAEDERDRAIEQQIAAFERQLERMERRRPWATYSIASVMIVVFALQLAWGEGDPVACLVEMGSLVPFKVREGEVWRILSSVFLHASVPHLVFNTLALVVLGGFIERVLSGRRLLVLFLLSAIGGNIASLAIHPFGQSVGASGGIWGLLGAGALLGLRSAGVLHPALVPGVRRAALINLGLNVVVSFLPQVNMAAHLGGTAVGAMAMLTGALTWGLPRFGPGDDYRRRTRMPIWLASVAWIIVGAYAASIGLAWKSGRPWSVVQHYRLVWEVVELDRLGIKAEVPTSLARVDVPDDEEGTRYVRYGGPPGDPLVVLVGSLERPTPLTYLNVGMLRDAEAMLAEPQQGLMVERAPYCTTAPGGPYCVAWWRSTSDGARSEVVLIALPEYEVVVHVVYDPSDAERFENTAARIAESVRRD